MLKSLIELINSAVKKKSETVFYFRRYLWATLLAVWCKTNVRCTESLLVALKMSFWCFAMCFAKYSNVLKMFFHYYSSTTNFLLLSGSFFEGVINVWIGLFYAFGSGKVG